jgi:hypothetical protein
MPLKANAARRHHIPKQKRKVTQSIPEADDPTPPGNGKADKGTASALEGRLSDEASAPLY